ncbi:MAG: PEP-CTERM sorting domain-containing protein [Cyanobacteria bacterium P01_A01_bin.84]
MTYIKSVLKIVKLLKQLSKQLSITALGSATIMLVTVEVSKAVVLTFDDIEPVETYGRVPDNYGGLNWDNFGFVNSSFHPGSGYDRGVASGKYTAFNWRSGIAKVSGNGFDFNSASFASAWNNNLNILVEGFAGDGIKYSTTVIVNPDAPSSFDFNYQDIDRLVFTSSGGIDANPSDKDSGSHFALDNFTFDFAQVDRPGSGNGSPVVPEPITVVGSLIAAGFGAIFYRKSRK